MRIRLEDSPSIPPTGQFIGVNGKVYMLHAGDEVEVPEVVTHYLDLAGISYRVIRSRFETEMRKAVHALG